MPARGELDDKRSKALGSREDEPLTITFKGAEGCSSWRICLSWLPYPLNNSTTQNSSDISRRNANIRTPMQNLDIRSRSQEESPSSTKLKLCIILALYVSSYLIQSSFHKDGWQCTCLPTWQNRWNTHRCNSHTEQCSKDRPSKQAGETDRINRKFTASEMVKPNNLVGSWLLNKSTETAQLPNWI